MSRFKNENMDNSEEHLASLPIVGKVPKNEKEEKYLKEICEFEFYNLEEPGMSIKFPYGGTRKHHNFLFFHGGKYRLPRHVARHIESRSTPIYDWRPNGTGKMVKQLVGEKPRFQMRHVFAG